MSEPMPQMTEQWKCKQCGFPENFLDTCTLCGAVAPTNVRRGNYPPECKKEQNK